MPRNIEIKARVVDPSALAAKVVALASEGPTLIEQDDTFFACSGGRLKLRAFPGGTGELIFYRRADQAGPKESFYVRSPTPSPDSLREALTLAHGQAGRVRKKRRLYLVGRTRVHLDEVEQLGHFLELEVVLADGESAEDGMGEAHALITSLGIEPAQLVDQAYVDLLLPGTRLRAEAPLPPNRSIPASTVIPELGYEDVAEAAAWLCRAFGFTERLRIGNHRVQLNVGSGAVVVTDRSAGPGSDPGSAHSVMVRVADADAHFERARAAGARVFGPPASHPYGERQYTALDLGGHAWTFTQSVDDVDPASWGGVLV
jgi:adenylate cyclase class IV/uncharacterized glyoxalase superfamily protein PhnB